MAVQGSAAHEGQRGADRKKSYLLLHQMLLHLKHVLLLFFFSFSTMSLLQVPAAAAAAKMLLWVLSVSQSSAKRY